MHIFNKKNESDDDKKVQIYQPQRPEYTEKLKEVDISKIDIGVFRPHAFETKISMNSKAPVVVLTDLAYDKHCCICSIVEARTNDEVSWLGIVKREGHMFIIEDIFLIDQEVHPSETEMITKGLGDLATELLQRPDGLDLTNRLMYWGHYHTFNSFNPSSQDDTQILELKNSGYPFFIRGIACRSKTIKFDIYLFDQGLTFTDVPWGRMDRLDRDLLLQLNNEFSEKVKPIRFVQTYQKRWPYQGGYQPPIGSNKNSEKDNDQIFSESHKSAPAGRGTFPRNETKVVVVPDEVELTEEEFYSQFNDYGKI